MTSSSFLITPTPQQSDSVAPTLALVSSSLTIYILACDFSSERLHPIANKMASRRSRSTQATSSRITDEQIADLLAKLQALLPEHRIRSTDRVSIIRSKLLLDVSTRSISMNCWLLYVVAIGVGSWGPTRRMQPYQELAARGGWLKWKARTVARHDRQQRRSSRGDPKPPHVNYLVHLCSLIQWRSTTSCQCSYQYWSISFTVKTFLLLWLGLYLSIIFLVTLSPAIIWSGNKAFMNQWKLQKSTFLVSHTKFFLWLIEKKASATKFWILLQNPKGQILLPVVFLFFFSFVNLRRFDSFLHKPTCKRRIWHN